MASIFKRCKTRKAAMAEAEGKGIIVLVTDETAAIHAKILMHNLGVHDPAADPFFAVVLQACQRDYREVKALYGMQKGAEYEKRITESIVEALEERVRAAEVADDDAADDNADDNAGDNADDDSAANGNTIDDCNRES